MLGIRLLELFMPVLGRRGVWFCLYPAVLYFFLVRGEERRASAEYLERVLERKPAWTEVFQHFMTFAKVSADRFFLAGKQGTGIDVSFYGTDTFHALVDRKQCGVLLAAHFGSFDAGRIVAVEHPEFGLKIVLDSQVNANFMRRLAAKDGHLTDSLIDPYQPAASLGIEVAETVNNGNWVGFLADRRVAGQRSIEGILLGSKVRIPAGPFMVAAALKTPVVAMFPVFRSGAYEVYCEVLSESVNAPRACRDECLSGLAQNYLNLLERHIKDAPLNWFNYYDYWSQDDD